MKAKRTFRRWGAVSLTAWGILMSGSPLLAAGPARRPGVSPSTVNNSAALAVATEKFATNIEVAWLSMPALFKCRLQAKITNNAIELCGFVPNDAVAKKAIEIAQGEFGGKVVSRLRIQPGMPMGVGLASTPNELATTATAHLTEQMGDKIIGLQLSCPKTGCIELSGTVASDADRLELSKSLQGLTGCVQVVNRTTTTNDGMALASHPEPAMDLPKAPSLAPTIAPPPKTPVREKPKAAIVRDEPAIIRTAARAEAPAPRVQKNVTEGPILVVVDGPTLDIKPEVLVKAPAPVKEQVFKTSAPMKEPVLSAPSDGPTLPIVQEFVTPATTIHEVTHQEVVDAPHVPVMPPHASMTTKPNVGRAMIIVPAVGEENKVEQETVITAPPAPVMTIVHERRPEILPTPVKQPIAKETPAPTYDAANPKQDAPASPRNVVAPVSSMPEWKTIPADSRPSAANVESNQTKTEVKAPLAQTPVMVAPAVVPAVAQPVSAAPVIQQTAQVALAVPTVTEAPKVVETPKCVQPPVETVKPVVTCTAQAPAPMAATPAPVVEAPKPIELPKPSQPVVQPVAQQVAVEVQPKQMTEAVTPVTAAPKTEQAPVVEQPKAAQPSNQVNAKASGFAAVRAAKVEAPVAQLPEPKATVKVCQPEQKSAEVCEKPKASECSGTVVKTDCHFPDSKPIVSLASFSKNGAAAQIDNSSKQACDKQMGAIRVPLASGQSPVSQESARIAVEGLCRGGDRIPDVRTTGAQQITVSMKVKTHSEWSDLQKQMKSLSDIAGYSVVYRIDVGEGAVADNAARPASATSTASAKQGNAPMMGVIRGKSTGNPLEADAVRSVIETVCKVHTHDVTVKSAGNRQVSIAMKVANPADWDQLYSRIRQMPEIADYAVIFNVRVQ